MSTNEPTENDLIFRDEFVAEYLQRVVADNPADDDLLDKMNEVIRNSIDIAKLREAAGWYPEVASLIISDEE